MTRELHQLILKLKKRGVPPRRMLVELGIDKDEGVSAEAVRKWASRTLRETYRRDTAISAAYERARTAPKEEEPDFDDVAGKDDVSFDDNLLTGEKKVSGTITVIGEDPPTPEDFLDRCGIDPSEWQVIKFGVRSYGTSMKLRKKDVEDPITVRTWSAYVDLKPNYIERKVEAISQRLVEILSSAKAPKVLTPRKKGRFLLTLNMPDAHFGKQATVESEYTLDEARRIYGDAVEYLIGEATRGYDIGKVLITFGHDGSQIDADSGATTKGTGVEFTGTWEAMFLALTQAWRDKLVTALEVAPVHVWYVPGNHDRHTAYGVTHTVLAAFEKHKHVTTDITMWPRKYFDYGATFLCGTHGKHESEKNIISIIQAEKPVEFANAVYRECQIGHKHHRQKTRLPGDYWEDSGVIWRMSPSLSPADMWHARMGFITAMRGAEAHVFDREAGHKATFSYVPNSPAPAK